MKFGISAAAVILATLASTGTALATTADATPAHRPVPAHSQQCAVPAVINANGPRVFPHSVDYDPRSNRFVVGSLDHSTISTVSLNGTVRTLVDDKKLVSVQAVRVDSRRNRVLATNVDYGLADRSSPSTEFRVAGLASYDLTTGHWQWYLDLGKVAHDGRQHLLSDVTVAPDGTAYAVDELTSTVFRIDRNGRASVLLRSPLLAGTENIPMFLSHVGQTAVTWMPGNFLIIALADGSLVRVPLSHPAQAGEVRLSSKLSALTAGLRVLPDGSIAAISSGLLTGKAAVVQHIRPISGNWKAAIVTVTDSVADPVSSALTAGPHGSTYALSGGLAALLNNLPNSGFTLRTVKVG
ncbi:hypothetical protein EDD99_4175 [Streptomyces sp. 846.5]|nr:hypothetical protein [Streptomyces sp. 846.5]TDU05647.1 hypothetical protein EDD99_4175 [Streptomyces sp. 846.5]